MTKVYAAHVKCMDDRQLFDYFYKTLPDYRKKKADKIHYEKEKHLSVGAWVLLSHALKREGLTNIPEIRFSEKGKPFFPEAPDIHFNISHSGQWVMCAVSDSPVGCDIEKIASIDLNIADKYFSKQEYEFISLQPESLKTDAFFRFWTLKESFLKNIGKGLTVKLHDFDITIDDEITVTQSLEINKKFYFKEFSIDDYKLACCSSSKDISDINIIDLSKIKE